ncbi:MAG: pyroglutamyl-peptidase I [Nitrososphaerota archaeon]
MQKTLRILLTGFQPWAGFDPNPSEEVAKAFNNKKIGRGIVSSIILPVSFKKCFEVLKKGFEREGRPDIFIGLGLMPFASAIQIERVAINIKDYDGVPDNDGERPVDEPIVAGGPNALFSTLPIRKIVENLNKAGIPAIISNSAGTHCCNLIMYNVLYYLSERGWNIPAGFIHLPFLPQNIKQIMHKPQNTPGLPLDVMVRALQLSIETILEYLDS